MDLNAQLFEDSTVYCLLWALQHKGEIDRGILMEHGFTDVEAANILKDEAGRLRALKRRVASAAAITPESLAAMLRAKLSEMLSRVEKSTELSSLLRSLKGLPDWLFPQWKLEAEEQRNLDALRRLAEKSGVLPALGG
ncbi:MAG: hypothetical protein H7A35_07490 [Planctomycetales bacterium]|nr:hypothetical protein [bacterium]UNM09894.1 MAG: hypothetical protein H7A35_07490 [Planctomycetales bacterium]